MAMSPQSLVIEEEVTEEVKQVEHITPLMSCRVIEEPEPHLLLSLLDRTIKRSRQRPEPTIILVETMIEAEVVPSSPVGMAAEVVPSSPVGMAAGAGLRADRINMKVSSLGLSLLPLCALLDSLLETFSRIVKQRKHSKPGSNSMKVMLIMVAESLEEEGEGEEGQEHRVMKTITMAS
jgi:hypothetical protein